MKTTQQRILDAAPTLGFTKPSELLGAIRNSLHRARSAGRLVPRGAIEKIVQLTPDRNNPAIFTLTGGTKDFKREEGNAGLIRDDLAWLHFTITLVTAPAGPIEILGYDFEIVFEPPHTPPWIRFDLNLPGHQNETRELRSHCHPGNDDLQIPAPIMTPLELIELYIDGLRPRDTARVRQ